MRLQHHLLRRIAKSLDKLTWIIYPRIPGTLINIVGKRLDKTGETILDVGGGDGHVMIFLNKNKLMFAVNADITLSSLVESKRLQSYDEYVLCDACILPFRDKSFDIVICSEVVEHLEKQTGLILLKELERVACKQVVVTTPPEYISEDALAILKEKRNEEPRDLGHVSSWLPYEFTGLGYKVRKGNGLRFIVKRMPVDRRHFAPFLFFGFLHVLTCPLIYFFFADSGSDIICIKDLSQN